MSLFHFDLHLDHETREDLHCICHSLREIVALLHQLVHTPAATGFTVTQIGAGMPTNNSIVAGTVGTFQEVPFPAGSALQAGSIPVWTVDDTANVTLTPSADGTSVAAAVSATDPNPSFNLTVSGIASDGTAISMVTNVTVTPAAVTPATGFTVTQLS